MSLNYDSFNYILLNYLHASHACYRSSNNYGRVSQEPLNSTNFLADSSRLNHTVWCDCITSGWHQIQPRMKLKKYHTSFLKLEYTIWAEYFNLLVKTKFLAQGKFRFVSSKKNYSGGKFSVVQRSFQRSYTWSSNQGSK